MAKYSKISTIIKHEYFSKVKSKGFIIGTILGPLAIILIFAIIVFVAVISTESGMKKIAVLDHSNLIGLQLQQSDTSSFYLTTLNQESLSEKVKKEEIDGYMKIPENILESNKIKVVTKGGGGINFINKIESKINYFVRLEKLKLYGVESKLIDKIESRVQVDTEKITEEGHEKDFTEAYAVLGYVLGFIIYIFMFIYGSFVSRGVIEEKANRIIEVIASSAKPFEIMMGKILGIGLVGLTQVLFWIILLIALLVTAQPVLMSILSDPNMMMQGMMTPQQVEVQENMGIIFNFISPGIIFGFIFYFLSGYFIYSTLFAAIGSAVDQESDAQQLMTPVTMLIIIPMLFISVIMTNPDSTVSIILSLIPFFTPILMIVRIAATQVPIWQILLSVILILLTFFTSVWIASRIYRIGILMYGKKPTFKDLIKWIKIT